MSIHMDIAAAADATVDEEAYRTHHLVVCHTSDENLNHLFFLVKAYNKHTACAIPLRDSS